MWSTSPEEYAASLITVENVVIFPVSSLLAMYFVYGLYVLTFGIYLYGRRGHCHEQRLNGTTFADKPYLGLITILFVLSTTFVIVYTIDNVGFPIILFNALKTKDYQTVISYSAHGSVVFYSLEWIIPALLNFTADLIVVHRCYAIWSFDKRIGIPSIIASVVINATGIIGIVIFLVAVNSDETDKLSAEGDTVSFAFIVGSAVVNAILTLLTAGRIWWIHRQVRAHGALSSDRLVQTVCRIIFESGLLYPLCQTTALIANNAGSGPIPFDFLPISTLSAGIAPTLIMVRANLGKNVESLQNGEFLSDIRFNNNLNHGAGDQEEQKNGGLHGGRKTGFTDSDSRESSLQTVP